MAYRVILFFFLLAGVLFSTAQEANTIGTFNNDTTVYTSQQNIDDRSDDSAILLMVFPFLGMLLLGALLIIVAVILIAIGLLALFALISFGVVSASVIVGYHQRSFTKGFKIFVVGIFTAIGAIGFGAFGLLTTLINYWADYIVATLTGVAIGAFLGAVLGLIVFYILNEAAAWLKRKMAS